MNNTKHSIFNWSNLGYGYNFSNLEGQTKELRKRIAKKKIEEQLFPALLSELTTTSIPSPVCLPKKKRLKRTQLQYVDDDGQSVF